MNALPWPLEVSLPDRSTDVGGSAVSRPRRIPRTRTARQQAAARRLFPVPGGADPTLNRLTALVATLLKAEASQVSLLTDVQTAVSVAGEAQSALDKPVPLRDSFCLIAATTNSPLVVTDARSDQRVSRMAPVQQGEIGSYLGVPLAAEVGETVGALCVYGRAPHEWTDTEIALMQQLAATAVAQLELAAMAREFESSRARWDLAVEAAGIGSFDLDLYTGRATWDDRMFDILGFDVDNPPANLREAFQARMHPSDRPVMAEIFADAIDRIESFEFQFRIREVDGRIRWLQTRGRVLTGLDGKPIRVLGATWDVTSMRDMQAGADRLIESMSVGYMALDKHLQVTQVNAETERLMRRHRRELVGHSPMDLLPGAAGELIEEVCRTSIESGRTGTVEVFCPPPLNVWFEVRACPEPAGAAVFLLDVTARRQAMAEVEQDAARSRSTARALQDALLGPVPRPPGLEVATRYLAYADGDQVGGDWWDAVPHADGSTTVMIGDVMGHDIEAAAVMGQLRSMLRAFVWESDGAPSGAMSRLDRAIAGLGLKTLVTAVAARIDPATGIMRWTNAGHPPPIVLRADGSTEVLLRRQDVMLGVRPDHVRQDNEVTLGDGDIALFFTDGLIESRQADLGDGIDRLRAALSRCAGSAPEALIDVVVDELVDQSFNDDVAVMAIRPRRQD